ncbi:hypothetical protein GXP70_09840 [Paenibacillus lycopersici]|uniref:Uncharacterized protein n=1 Tax=Paenibacillus lycopersici TaxID=2704462 RepID=A0A6C0FXJ0_9BACL|nr:hypothetical protein [Paenibacillus lycopersici]QHT60213.1 hypothetical protein GXP70_09840 [Paenibacillus lycopersici]
MKRGTAAAALIMSQLVYLVSLVAWLFVLGMSVMGFDSPKAAYDVTTWLIFIYILIYPAAILGSMIAGWILFARRRRRAAMLWNGIPLLWLLPLIALLIYAFAS